MVMIPIREEHGFLPDYRCRNCNQLIVSIPFEIVFNERLRKHLVSKFPKCKKCGCIVDWSASMTEMEKI